MAKMQKREAAAPSAVVAVLSSRDLVSTVCRFQVGIYFDMLAIRDHMRPYELKHYTLQYCPDDVEELLAQYPSSRLPLLSECMPYMRNVLFLMAAQFGNLRLLWSLEARYTLTTTPGNLVDLAAQNGHFDVLKYLHYHAPSVGCTTSAMDSAAANGHLDIVKFLHTHRNEGCTTRALDYAAEGGHLDVVRFLHTNRDEGGEHAMHRAASNGHVDVFLYLSNATRGLLTFTACNGFMPTR